MSKILHRMYEKARTSLRGPSLMLTAAMLFTTVVASMAQSTLVQIGAGGPTSSGGFENAAPTGVPSADFAANNWTVAQSASVNRFWVGTAGTQAAGNYHAFVGPDGSTWSGTNTASWSHLYRDVTIPPGESILTISYRYKITVVDATFDFVTVRVGPTTAAPTAGSAWTPIGATLLQQQDGTTSYANYSTSTSATPGTTVRVVISFRNDGFAPAGAAALDDIQVQSSVPSTFTATAQGGLWNSPGTWVGGVVPGSGNDIVIPAGSTVMVNQVNTYRNLSVSGNMLWNGTFAQTFTGNVTVNSGGFINTYSTLGAGQTINIAGDLENNGTINAVSGTLNFNGTGNSQLSGTGNFVTSGSRGIIRSLQAQNAGTFTLNQSQNITVSSVLVNTCNNFVTNGKIRVDNANDYFSNDVLVMGITAMGSGYATAPNLAVTGAQAWVAGATPLNAVRINAGHQYVSLDAVSSSTAPTHTSNNVVNPGDGKLWLHIGPVGTIGTALGSAFSAVANTQYVYNNRIYTCVTAGAMTAVQIQAAMPISTTVGTAVTIGTNVFRCVGTAVRATLNHDAVNSVVRSVTIVSAGTGISSTQNSAIVGGGGTGATLTALYSTSLVGPATAQATKATASVFTGAVDTRHSTVPAGAAGNGVYSATPGASTRGWYNTVPSVGFSAPLIANLVTAQGSGYGATPPTVSVSGGTLLSGTAMVAGDFQVNVAGGRVVSVYYNGATTKIYSVPPTISLTGGSGAGATISWGTSWPSASVTLSGGTSGQITGITITNNGYGYATAPTMAFSATVVGEAAATTPTCRLQQLDLRWGFFTPQTTNPNNNSVMAMVPSNNRINGFIVTSGAQTFTASIEAAAAAPLSTFTGSIDMGGSNTVRFSHPDYAGTAGAVGNSITNGTIELSLRGGNTTSATRTFPLSGGTGATAHFIHATGSGTSATGFTYTGIRATRTGAPSGSVSPAGSVTGIRTVRIDLVGTGALDNLNTGRTMTMFYNVLDNLIADNASLFLAQGGGVSGPWDIRSTAAAAGTLPTTGSRATASAAPGPYTNSSTMFFAWVNNGFVVPPGLSYNVVRTGNNTYNSIASAAKGGDGSGIALTGWTGSANDEEQATISLPGWAANFQGSAITGVRVHTNGFLQIINGATTFPTNPWNNNFAATDVPNAVAAFWEDLVNKSVGGDNRDNSIIYSITGTSPNRVLTVEWANMTPWNADIAANLAFQIQLIENNGSILINYGDNQMFNGTVERRYSYSVGIKGGYNSAFPVAGQVFAQQYENYNLFSHIRTQTAHLGANGLGVSPEPRSRYTFTPGVYTPPGLPGTPAPANDARSNAESITALSTFPSNVSWNVPDSKSRIYSTRFATADPEPACGGGPANAKDVWFKFTAQEINTTVRIYPSGGFIPRIQVFDNTLTSIFCAVGAQGAATDAALVGLALGDEYLVRVSHDRVGTQSLFTGSTVAGGEVTGVSIVNGGSGYTTATATFNGPTGARMSTTGGGGSTFVGAVNAVTAGQVTGGGFNGGNDYLSLPSIEVESPDWGITGEFAIVIYAPPINDDCAGAIELTGVGGSTCTPGSNQRLAVITSSATESAESIGTCSGTKDDDLWYKFTATGNRSRLQVQGSGGFNPSVQLWAGATCAAKGFVSCSNATGANGLEDVEFATTPGTIYWIRVYDNGAGTSVGSFDICVTTIPDVDVRPRALINPLASTCGSAAQQVSVRIQNRGALPLAAGTNIDFNVNITNAIVASLIQSVALPATLAVNDSVTLNVGTFNMSANGTYNFAVSATTASDGNLSNDVLTPAPSRILNVVAAPTYNDGLNAQGSWIIQQLSGTGNWAFTNTAQPNGSTPNVPFFEGSGYLYFNSYSFSASTSSRAISPCLDLSPSICSRMTFRMKRDDGFLLDDDRVEVRVSTDGGNTFSSPLTLSNLSIGGSGTSAARAYDTTGTGLRVWHLFEANLSAYVGQTIKIALDATSEFGNNIMVDEFRVLQGLTNDVAPIAVIAPLPGGVCGSSSTSVVIRFRNNSCFPAVDVPYSVSISGPATPSILSGTVTLAPGAEVNETVGNISISGNAPLGFTVSTSLTGDEVLANNSIGPISVPLRGAPVVTASIAEPNIVFGFTTVFNASAVIASPTAGVTNSTIGQIDGDGTNPAQQSLTRNIVVSGFGNLAANQIVSATLNIAHTWTGDLIIRLTDPTGITRILSNRRGGGGDNFTATVFGSTGPSITTGTAPFTGNFQPEEAFSGFSAVASSANGTWILEIQDAVDDASFSGGGGNFLNATLSFANAISSAAYACPTCPSGFPAAAANPLVSIAYPNNPLGTSYPVGSYPISLTVNDRAGCSVVENFTLDVFTENSWVGAIPGADNWQEAANWLAAPRPPTSLVAVNISAGTQYAPNITTNANAGSMVMGPGAQITVASGSILNVAANWNGGLSTDVLGAGTVRFNGSGIQTISGATNFQNLRVEKTAGTVRVSGLAVVKDVLTLGSGTSSISTIGTGKIILRSTPTSTGKLAPVPTGATISGNFVMERHVPHTGTSGWYFIGSPITGKNFTDWADNFRMFGISPGFGTQGGGVLPTTDPNRVTVFKYLENTHGTYVDTVQKRGWRFPGNENILPGTGYRVFISPGHNPNSRFDNVGTPVFGTFTFPTLTRNTFPNCVFGGTASWATNPCTEAARGWNLLANPYPAPLNWDASGLGTWTKSGTMNNAFYTWNSSSAGYRIYLGAGGSDLGETFGANTNTPAGIIPSSQAFFVKLTSGSSAGLSVGENAKFMTSDGTFARIASNLERIRIRLTNEAISDSRYDGMMRFDATATNNFDQHMDADALIGNRFGYSFLTDDGNGMVMNTVPYPSETKVIPMNMVYNGISGNYKFSFLDASTFFSGVQVYLRDNYLGTLTDLLTASEYSFMVLNGDGSNNPGRFEIVISPSSVTGISKLIDGFGMGLFPNPTSGNSDVTLAVRNAVDGGAAISIIDVIGKTVYSNSMQLKANEMTEKVLTLNLPAGVYTVKVSSNGKTFNEKLVIR